MKSLSVKLGVILVIGLLIFTYEEMCKAQCAWVLWESQYINQEGKVVNPGEWNIITAYPRYEQCLERQKETFFKFKEEPGYTVISRPFEYALRQKEDGKHTIIQQLKCLPDTIDPRK